MVSRNIGIISSTELQRSMNTADEAMELEHRKILEKVAAITRTSVDYLQKLIDRFRNKTTDWDSIFKNLEGQEDALEDYVRSRQRKRMRDACRHRRGDRPRGRGRDWRRAELPAQKSYVRRWKFRETRLRRDFRRRRT